MKKNKILLLAASAGCLAVLAAAAWQENGLREWRVLQRAYAARLGPQAAGEFHVQLRQVVAPRLRAMDRCVSCHVGMAPGEQGFPGDRVFRKHADVVHGTDDYGCVVCHAGQGRATESADAHGAAPFWPTPMIPARFAYAGCGACHTDLGVPNAALLDRGRELVEREDCLSCHRLDGRGGTIRPGGAAGLDGGDLSRVGAHGYDRGWYAGHLARRAAAAAGPWKSSFGPIPEEDLAALETFLASRVGAPGLVEAKALFHSLGCRGCHKVGGVGGDDGPDLTRIGEKDPGRIDFSRVPGEPTLANYFAEHFRSPAAVVPGSAMPALGLREDQIERLTCYMLSLRRSDLAEALWPRDRIRSERFGEREFATDGGTLYGTFCSACHGLLGQGMRYAGSPPFPAIGSRDFLALASDDFLRETVRRGRPGRRMPAWGEKDGGLRPQELEAVVAFLRAMGGAPPEPDPRPARWARGDAEQGGRLYAANCASCHGPAGEGKEGPALANPVLLASATDTYLYETIRRGRTGTSMPSFAAAATTHRDLAGAETEAIVSYLRTWEKKR